MVSAASTHENQSLRGALLRVFTEVLSRRMDPLTFGLAPKIPSYDDALHELMSMLLAPDRELARLLCASARGREAEEVAKALLLICEKQDKDAVAKLLDWTIEHEIANTARLGTLFRSESMGTKLMGAYFGSKGKSYLVATLKAPVLQFLRSSLILEVDPNKGADPSKIKENIENLQNQTEIFLNAIVDSARKGCPQELKHVLAVLREETVKKFNATEGCDRIAVAGYTFLRFFCPAIAMPTKLGLTVENDSEQQSEALVLTRQQTRGLLLIAKILQNLANGTHFFEECMEPLNPWIDSHAAAISYFCFEISCEDTWASRQRREDDHEDIYCDDNCHRDTSPKQSNDVGKVASCDSGAAVRERSLEHICSMETTELPVESMVVSPMEDDSENSSDDDEEEEDDSGRVPAMISTPANTDVAASPSGGGSRMRKRQSFKKPYTEKQVDNDKDAFFTGRNWSEELQAALVSIHKYMYFNQERLEHIMTPTNVQVAFLM